MTPSAPTPIDSFATALTLTGQPAAGFAALDRALASSVGHKLFTVLLLDIDKGQNRRFYTSHPDAYPG